MGDHQPIIARTVWDRVQAILWVNRNGRVKSIVQTGRLLTGLIFDERGNRMSPSIVRNRHGRQYAYYVSRPSLSGQPERAGALARVAAGEIEALVEARMQALLRKPAPQKGDGSTSAGQAERVRALLRRIIVAPEYIAVDLAHHEDFDPSKIKRMSTLADDRFEDGQDGFTIRVPIRLRARGGGEQMIEAGQEASMLRAARLDRPLIKAVARAHAWRILLEEGVVSSTMEIANRAGCHVRYVRNLLKLAFLAPDLVDAILGGKTLPSKLADLISSDLALSWAEQRSSLAPRGAH